MTKIDVKGTSVTVISGGTDSGKTTLLNCLTGYIDADERVITCEDTAELQLQQPHVVRLETRPPNIEGEGEITFTHRGPGVISADHTGVPDAMAGQGVAKALLNDLLEDARQSGFRIIPVCPYVRTQYARHPEWAELFTTKPGEDP